MPTLFDLSHIVGHNISCKLEVDRNKNPQLRLLFEYDEGEFNREKTARKIDIELEKIGNNFVKKVGEYLAKETKHDDMPIRSGRVETFGATRNNPSGNTIINEFKIYGIDEDELPENFEDTIGRLLTSSMGQSKDFLNICYIQDDLAPKPIRRRSPPPTVPVR